MAQTDWTVRIDKLERGREAFDLSLLQCAVVCADQDSAVALDGLCGIVQQVEHHLAHLCRIGLHGPQIGVRVR